MEKSYTYNTVNTPSEGFFRDRGSKFHGYIFPVENREEALLQLTSIKEDHKKARHHCFAWRIGGQGQDYRIADDGEPSGSAGQPIFNQLLSFDVTNIMAIVVRYFGGTKLGIPGLINAYKSAIYDALNQAIIEERSLSAFYSIQTTYDHAARLLAAFKEKDCDVTDVAYLDYVTFNISVPALNHEPRIKQALTVGYQLQALEMLEQLPENELQITLKGIEE